MVTALQRIEAALITAVGRADVAECPGQLAAAMRYAVFPGGARVRPRLTLAVASACGDDAPALTDAAAAAVELLHCASLVHDDLPCFDDAETRRGKPSVHRAFGERLAVLTGDALIVLGFETAARAAVAPQRLCGLITTIASAVGVPGGIVAGQAWECEPCADLGEYQRQKTGALFAGATMAGAAAAGAPPGAWRVLGERLGEAYQVADDIGDAVGDPDECGKPIGRDAALGRPSTVAAYGIDGAMARLEQLVREAVAAIPPCVGEDELKALIRQEARRLVPKQLVQHAA